MSSRLLKIKTRKMDKIFLDNSMGQILEKYQSKELTPLDVAQSCVSRVKKLEDKYKAWVCFDEKKLLAEAEKIKLSDNPGNQRLLEGMPVGVKDVFNTTDFPAQMGSKLWENFTPGNDARAVFNIKRQGAIIPGKTVTAEFAVHTPGKTLNPHNIKKSTGTSSSGSAVAVALGMVPSSLGTQTAGSIMRPASFCGVYGCKPSFGLIPRTGILKTTDTLDTVGFFTVFQKDLRRVFDAIRVKGANFPFSNEALNNQNRQNKPENRPWKVAFVRTYTWDNAYDYAQKSMLEFVKKISDMTGIEANEVDLPDIVKNAHKVHGIIYNKTLSYYFKNEFQKPELISPVMSSMIKTGNQISVNDYHKALTEQTEIQSVMDDFFKNYDIIISLSTAGEAQERNETERPDPCLIWTLSHLPAVNIPLFVSPSRLPFGLQVVARKYNDYLLFNFIDYLAELKLIPEKPNPLLNI